MNTARAHQNQIMSSEDTLLDQTLAAARADTQTVTGDGNPIARLPDGMSFREVPTHVDDRGSVVEMFDTRWGWTLTLSALFTPSRSAPAW